MFALGDLITNGGDAGEVIEIVARDPAWKVSGVRVRKLRTEEFGGNVGMSEFVADYLGWRIAPQEWTPIPGGLEERWAWTPGYGMFRREVRKP